MKRILFLLLIATFSFTLAGCSSSDKPSKEEVVDALMKNFDAEDSGFEDEAAARDFADCLVDGFYDDVSTDSLEYITDEDSLEDSDEEAQKALGKKDYDTFTDAAEKCFTDQTAE